VIIRIAVVLPAPFGPSSTVMLRSGTRRFRSVSAGTEPNERRTWSSATT
jgi:hypothetical protein